MKIFRNLIRGLGSKRTGQSSWTPEEVRSLIDDGELAIAQEAVERLSASVTDRLAEQASLRGEIAFHRKDDEGAAREFGRALELVPGLSSAHYGMSLLLAEKGQFEDGARHAQFALAAHPKESRYLAQVGYCQLCMGNFQAAENPLRRATLSTSSNRFLWNNLGIVLRAKGELAEARECFERALALDPQFALARGHLHDIDTDLAKGDIVPALSIDNAHALRAGLTDAQVEALMPVLELERKGELKAAIDACETLLLDHPDEGHFPLALSRLYERVGDVGSAIDALRAYRVTHPQDSRVAGALGLVHLRANEFGKAQALLVEAVAQEPDHLDFVIGLARAYAGLELFADAGPHFRHASELAPDDLGLQGQLASNLANACRYEESMAIIDEFVARGMHVAYRGSVLAFLGRFDEALEGLNDDVARQPNEPGLRFQRAQLHLLMGNFEQGWDDYNFRSLTTAKSYRMLPYPVWRGEPLEGKRIVVLAEQGLGDQIMFASCLQNLLDLGAQRVVVEMSHRVAKTIERSFSRCTVVASNQGFDLDWAKDYADSDYFVPLADLPGHFRRRLEDFPRHMGYLKADPQRVAYWRAKLEAAGPGPYIGVSWKGGTESTRSPVRSLTPEALWPMADAIRATWICLQYGDVRAAVDASRSGPMPLIYWPESIADLDEFAALISALDLVITVCNTTVHYTGGLGKPVWVLSPRIPEWRYGLEGESLPWYPSSRMFRQQVDRDWDGVIASVCQELSSQTVGVTPE